MSIRDWPVKERPREKLLEQGPAALGDAELLAIILRTGSRGRSAVEMARELLQEFGSLRGLIRARPGDLCRAHGLGTAKFSMLQAAIELAKRHLQENIIREDAFTHSEATREYLRAHLRDRHREVFCALFLDTRHRLIACEDLFQGSIDSTMVHPRVVVERALNHHAAAVIVAHNHPSGVSEPSSADINITRRLHEALALMEIRLLDHFIVGEGEPLSLAERGVISAP